MLRFGKISQIDKAKGVGRVSLEDDEIVSGWLPFLQQRTGGDKFFVFPKAGEHVALILDEHGEAGVIIGAIYDAGNQPPESGDDVSGFEFADGSRVEYDQTSGVLKLDFIQNITIIAAGDVSIECQNATIKADVSVNIDTPEATATGNLTVKGDFTTEGDAAVFGAVEAGADVSAGNAAVPISLLLHTHPVPAVGSPTGVPLP